MTLPILEASRYPRLPARLLRNARILPDRTAILPLLPKHTRIVEVGVGFGDFSRQIIDVCQPAHFTAIDLFDLHTLDELWGRSTAEVFDGETHEAAYRKRFAPEIAAGLMDVVAADSADALAALPDSSVDMCYLDANHWYEAVRRELSVVRTKMREDGWLVLNDYTPCATGFSTEPYGVIQACHEFMLEHDWEMTYLALAWVMYCDVVIKKVQDRFE